MTPEWKEKNGAEISIFNYVGEKIDFFVTLLYDETSKLSWKYRKIILFYFNWYALEIEFSHFYIIIDYYTRRKSHIYRTFLLIENIKTFTL